MLKNTSKLRDMAQEALNRARVEIATGEPIRLRYAALELRHALEALTYSRALAFKEFIPPEEYATWQPRKLMAVLVDIDPFMGMTSTLSVSLEGESEKPSAPETMTTLGTDTVLSLKDLKEHYDAIGSYLHMPSIQKIESGEMPDMASLRKRCENLTELIHAVLASQIWNNTFGQTSTLEECMNEECRKPIRKRIPFGQDRLEVQCFACQAAYVITRQAGGRTFWQPLQIDVPCSTAKCQRKMPLWPHEVKPKTNWQCHECGTHNVIALTVANLEGAISPAVE